MDLSLEEICQSINLEEYKINDNFNLSVQCEICYSYNHNDLFDISKANFKGISFHEIIEYFPSLKEHKDRDIENSFTLCTMCVSQLISSYLFINKLQMSNIKFEQHEAIVEFKSKVCLDSLNSNSSEDYKKNVAEQVINDSEEEHESIIHDHDYIQTNDSKETENFNDVEYIGNDVNYVVNVQEHNFGCYECGKVFARKQNMRKHIKRIHLKERKFGCAECGKQFFLMCDYNRHMALHRGEASFVCDICGRGYATATCLLNHKSIVHTEKKIKCDHCSKIFKLPRYLKAHIMNAHSTIEDEEGTPTGTPMINRIECDVCGKSMNRFALKTHMEAHTRDRKYQCKVCGAKFFQRTILNGHMLRHQEPKFSCEYCEKRFFKQLEKLSHIRRKHTREIVCTCQFCGEGFVHSYNLLRHIRSRHKDEL